MRQVLQRTTIITKCDRTVCNVTMKCGNGVMRPPEEKMVFLNLFHFVFLTNIPDVSTFSGQECNSYILNKEADRSVTHTATGSSYKCDKTLATSWYRFNSTSGFKMPTSCIAPNKCNTHATGWLNGAHPTPQEGIVGRTVCFNWSGKCCNWQLVITVRNCGLLYVYNLTKTDTCKLRYCVTN